MTAARWGNALGTDSKEEPDRDPYLNDPNIKRAASLNIIFGGALGAGLGWAIAGWFGFSIVIGSPSAP